MNITTPEEREALEASCEQLARRLSDAQPWSSGELLLARVWLEALTPGLRRLHASLKELTLHLTPPDPKKAPLNAPQLKSWLLSDLTLTPLLTLALTHLFDEREGAWWGGTREVADCGAQRDVLTRLTYKRLEGSYTSYAALMSAWAKAWEEAGALKSLAQKLTQGLSEAESEVGDELLSFALTHHSAPKALKGEALSPWLHAHRALREALYSASWREVADALRAMSAIAPKSPQLLMAWACLKAREGLFEEALKGVKRALETLEPCAYQEALAEALERWEARLAPPPLPEPEEQLAPTLDPSDSPHFQTAHTQALQAPQAPQASAETRHTRLAPPPPAHALGAEVDALGQLFSGQQEAWGAPIALLRALAALGPHATHSLASRGALEELEALLNSAQRQLFDARQRYAEVPALTSTAKQLSQAARLLEQLKQHAPQGSSAPYTGSRHGLSARPTPLPKLPSPEPAPPPPVPEHGTMRAPTAVINALSEVEQLRGEGEPVSLSLEQSAPLDLTLDEPPDLNRAQSLLKAGDFIQAEGCLLSLLDQNPFNPQAHNDLGVLNFQLHRFGDAKAHLILAIECEPRYEEAWENLVELFTSLGQLHHALPLFRRFEGQLGELASFERLRALCERFAPEGYEALAPPERQEGQEGLRLPLSGSFFLSPEAGEDPVAALSLELDPLQEAQSQERSEARERAQRELATQLRADVQSMLDAWQRELYTPPPAPKGFVPWLKRAMGQEEPAAPRPPTTFDELSLSAEGVTEALLELERAPEPVPTKPLPIDQRRVRNVAFSMLCVPSGTFLMGTDREQGYGSDQEHPRHRVVLSRPFQLAQMPVTQELYEAVMWVNPSHVKAPGHPVVRVSWFDALRFCNALSELEGLPPAYHISRGARPEVAFLHESTGYRLPTEAEWEYSARARQAFKYAGSESLEEVGWAQVDELHTVGRKLSNPWGFYDMSGNVWEWCNDALREYQDEAELDPKGDMLAYMHTPGARVIRGGSWCFEPDGARVAFRGRGAPGLRITSLGFRLARSV